MQLRSKIDAWQLEHITPHPLIVTLDFCPYQKWFGIRQEELPVDHYRLLGLKRFESDQETIRAAIEKRMNFLQDVSTGSHSSKAQALLNKVANAAVQLTHDEKKRIYDQQLQTNSRTPAPIKSTSTSTHRPNKASSAKWPLIYAFATVALVTMLGLLSLRLLRQPENQNPIAKKTPPAKSSESDSATKPISPAQPTSATTNPSQEVVASNTPPGLDQKVFAKWEFASQHLDGANLKATKGPSAKLVNAEQIQHLENAFLFGKKEYFHVGEKPADMDFPTQAISIESWLSIDTPTKWGAVFGAVQDNGTFERGVLLGNRDQKLCFAVRTEAGQNLTYLTSSLNFRPGRWYHVIGTYDGTRMVLYVDGIWAAESNRQSGEITYHSTCPIVIGAYRDDDEHYPFHGKIGEVTIYNSALSAEEVKSQFELKRTTYRPN